MKYAIDYDREFHRYVRLNLQMNEIIHVPRNNQKSSKIIPLVNLRILLTFSPTIPEKNKAKVISQVNNNCTYQTEQ